MPCPAHRPVFLPESPLPVLIAQNLNTGVTVLDGFVVYGGSTNGPGENSYGIWIQNSNASLTVKNMIVRSMRWAGSRVVARAARCSPSPVTISRA